MRNAGSNAQVHSARVHRGGAQGGGAREPQHGGRARGALKSARDPKPIFCAGFPISSLLTLVLLRASQDEDGEGAPPSATPKDDAKSKEKKVKEERKRKEKEARPPSEPHPSSPAPDPPHARSPPCASYAIIAHAIRPYLPPSPTLRLQEQEEKKKLQALILSIPKERDEIFSFPINWAIFDRGKLSDAVAKWTAKKVQELLGQEEQSLVEFIVEKVQAHAPASDLMEELQGILVSGSSLALLSVFAARFPAPYDQCCSAVRLCGKSAVAEGAFALLRCAGQRHGVVPPEALADDHLRDAEGGEGGGDAGLRLTQSCYTR